MAGQVAVEGPADRPGHHVLPARRGAAAVDRALYFVARRCSYAEIDRQVEKAREHDPVETERRRVEAAEKRHVKIHLGR